MKWFGRNIEVGGYAGESLDVSQYIQDLISFEQSHDEWDLDFIPFSTGDHSSLCPVLRNFPMEEAEDITPFYISAGIHGDEPAGPLAVCSLLKKEQLPAGPDYLIFPLLNPTGMRKNRRFNGNDVDLNREYHPTQISKQSEVERHVEFLQSFQKFKLAIMMHEDWEARGFYLYQLWQKDPIKYGSQLIKHLEGNGFPIDDSDVIDGRDAEKGLIDVAFNEFKDRLEWPEAFYLNEKFTHLSYTIESPSDLDLDSRVSILESATRFLIQQHIG